jgi:hypothetical protein
LRSEAQHAIGAHDDAELARCGKIVKCCRDGDGQHGFFPTHRFFHQHAVHQLTKPAFVIVQIQYVLFGGRAGQGSHQHAIGRDVAKLVKKIADRAAFGVGR